MTRGLVVGKFYPPHRGHQHLIETALAQVDHLTIILCWRPEERIAGELRRRWLAELYPQATVLAIHDTYDADDSRLWAENTIRWLGAAPDAVFTSEDYGHTYAHYLGCRHVQVDRDRVRVPVSGTAVRRDPWAHREFLDPIVRAHFLHRIRIVGAESTGTTTLAEALARHLGTVWVPEFGRLFAAWKDAQPGAPWLSSDFATIARTQLAWEDAAARVADRYLVCDTDAFATALWHRAYLGYPSPEVEAIAGERRYALTLLTDIDIPFAQDGTRDERRRETMHRWFLDELAARGEPYQLIAGSPAARLATAAAAIDALGRYRLDVPETAEMSPSGV